MQANCYVYERAWNENHKTELSTRPGLVNHPCGYLGIKIPNKVFLNSNVQRIFKYFLCNNYY